MSDFSVSGSRRREKKKNLTDKIPVDKQLFGEWGQRMRGGNGNSWLGERRETNSEREREKTSSRVAEIE